MRASTPDAYGDFQTPPELAAKVWDVLDTTDVDICVEPTVGKGAFLQTVPTINSALPWVAFDINPAYVTASKAVAASRGLSARIDRADALALTAEHFAVQGKTVLAVGNPPWVTSAGQGRLSKTNLPTKFNRFGLTGLDAMTGKSNFDLAESVLLGLLDTLRHAREIRLAFLVKRSVALKIARDLLTKPGIKDASFSAINAKRWFGASVEAGLLQLTCVPHETTSTSSIALCDGIGLRASCAAGLVAQRFVLNVASYERSRGVEAAPGKGFLWRQGIKHDAARVLEFKRSASGQLVNGFGTSVDVEPEALHPFYKSSDVATGRQPSHWFPLYQHDLTGPFNDLGSCWPKLVEYLYQHREQLAARGSSIYRGKPEFMLFGVGDYSLAPWKVAISGFYKKPRFTVLGPDHQGRVPLVDDTCYLLPFAADEAARASAEYLNSAKVQDFLAAIADSAAKRPFTKDILGRIGAPESEHYEQPQLAFDLAGSSVKVAIDVH